MSAGRRQETAPTRVDFILLFKCSGNPVETGAAPQL
ncbi:hypothetical protein BROSI_A2703 [Candidatus Brocadia sinica JPN1]|uniref:Uncharacterized protein n=1 Tax=Candidatus Brocadia sinica JPN1 TaxID=1197129 RepID=A0ABQ0K095_9BACT|nr:hypothetical protein BROSI_A2703 [Candidatus Brocadia sinica JPN1]